MAIDFTLTTQQRDIQKMAREFARDVLAPVVRQADSEPDPLAGFNLTKPAYTQAVKRGIAFSMLPAEYGGGGLSNVDFVIAAEEICAVDAGFATTILVNGLGLMPVWYYGTEEQKRTIHRRGHRRRFRGIHSRLRGERAGGFPGRHRELRRPGRRRRRHGRHGHAGRR